MSVFITTYYHLSLLSITRYTLASRSFWEDHLDPVATLPRWFLNALALFSLFVSRFSYGTVTRATVLQLDFTFAVPIFQ